MKENNKSNHSDTHPKFNEGVNSNISSDSFNDDEAQYDKYTPDDDPYANMKIEDVDENGNTILVDVSVVRQRMDEIEAARLREEMGPLNIPNSLKFTQTEASKSEWLKANPQKSIKDWILETRCHDEKFRMTLEKIFKIEEERNNIEYGYVWRLPYVGNIHADFKIGNIPYDLEFEILNESTNLDSHNYLLWLIKQANLNENKILQLKDCFTNLYGACWESSSYYQIRKYYIPLALKYK